MLLAGREGDRGGGWGRRGGRKGRPRTLLSTHLPTAPLPAPRALDRPTAHGDTRGGGALQRAWIQRSAARGGLPAANRERDERKKKSGYRHFPYLFFRRLPPQKVRVLRRARPRGALRAATRPPPGVRGRQLGGAGGPRVQRQRGGAPFAVPSHARPPPPVPRCHAWTPHAA